MRPTTRGSLASSWATISLKLEFDLEIYSTGTFHPSDNVTTIGFGGRYELHRPIILLFMAGRALRSASESRPYFLGYLGIQLLLPPKSYPSETPAGVGQPH